MESHLKNELMRPMVVRTVTLADIERCPLRVLSASHYRDDGSCLCAPEAQPTGQ